MNQSPYVTYADSGELLVIQRVLTTQPQPEEQRQREYLFHSRCTVLEKVCHLIIDIGSCTDIPSTTLVEKLGLVTFNHTKSYKLKWLNESEEKKVSKQVEVPCSIGNYRDKITCDIAPMEAGHILLGRAWQYDNRRTNHQSFTLNNQKFHTRSNEAI